VDLPVLGSYVSKKQDDAHGAPLWVVRWPLALVSAQGCAERLHDMISKAGRWKFLRSELSSSEELCERGGGTSPRIETNSRYSRNLNRGGSAAGHGVGHPTSM
jgi:hypothetical protein